MPSKRIGLDEEEIGYPRCEGRLITLEYGRLGIFYGTLYGEKLQQGFSYCDTYFMKGVF